MKKTFCILILATIFIYLPCEVFAVEIDEYYSQQFQNVGGEELLDNLPETSKEFFSKNEINPSDSQQLQGITPEMFLSEILDSSKDLSKSPIKAGLSIAAIIMLCALLEGMKTSFGEIQVQGIFGIICSMCMTVVIVNPIMSTIEHVTSVISGTSVFMLTFIPILATIMIAGGQTVAGTSYATMILGASEFVQYIVTYIVRPLLNIFLGISIASAISSRLKLSSITQQIHKVIKWALSIMMSIFVGVLTINGIIGKSSDTLGAKASKLFIGNMIPVVGGALSDAYSSVQGCLDLLKSSVGAFGIIAIAISYIPPILECLLWLLTINICITVCDLFEVTPLKGLLTSIQQVVSLMITICLCSALTLLVSTTIMIMLGGSVI